MKKVLTPYPNVDLIENIFAEYVSDIFFVTLMI